MLRSLFSGITGLRQHQTLMDVVGNNIANVNTAGFKSSSVVFEDTLSQMMRAAGAPSPGTGGVNPAQVGLGVQLGAISTNFAQGSAQNTGRATDLMIQGDGFFVLKNGNDQLYSRAGSFNFDTNGTFVNPEGAHVQGWVPDPVTGVLSTNGAPGDIVIPSSTLIPPKASTGVTVGGNIQPNTNVAADVLTLGQTVYDVTGAAHPLTITLTGDGAGNYTVSVTDANSATPTTAIDTGVTVAFDPSTGRLQGGTDVTDAITLPDAANTPVTLTFPAADPGGLTWFGGPKTANVTKADGYAAGNLQGFQIGTDGSVTGTFSNGQKLVLAKVALAGFNNPMGLEKAGNSTYRSTTNSGNAQINRPNSGGVGSLLGGAIEMSNVDLAQEFTNLIIAQRGFQANSRVITTSDQMLQDLVDIKR